MSRTPHAVKGQKLDPPEEGTRAARAEPALEVPVSTPCTLSPGRDSAPCLPSGAALAGSPGFGRQGVNKDMEMRIQHAPVSFQDQLTWERLSGEVPRR